MRGPRPSAVRCALLPALALALAAAGCSAGDTAADADAAGRAPVAYAPYVNASTASATDAAGSPTTYNLAFVISSGDGCAPAWDGVQDVDDAQVTSRIAALARTGADMRVSFGGAHGDELAAACDTAEDLAEAYGAALDAAGATRADFDIEGDDLTDSPSVDRRSEAIALLQEERDGLEVTFTLPVMPSGLDEESLALLKSANDHDLEVTTVNLMTMNYAESYDGDMGDYALEAARSAHAQLRDVFGLSGAEAWRGMALTPMLGVNDVANETFTLEDAEQVRAFAEDHGVAWVSVWSAFRDRPCDGDAADDPLTDCSGVEQEAGAFGDALAG
ncbi:chitinase [Streptomyces sp. S-9]|uniref:chitinase n=1 Tax=Streptomyces sp. S-9 TaxID=2806600 RepID=UPI00193B981F|nr:chitinase [Streptomyces sp. S-9]